MYGQHSITICMLEAKEGSIKDIITGDFNSDPTKSHNNT